MLTEKSVTLNSIKVSPVAVQALIYFSRGFTLSESTLNEDIPLAAHLEGRRGGETKNQNERIEWGDAWFSKPKTQNERIEWGGA